MQTGEAKDRTTNLPVSSWSALPPHNSWALVEENFAECTKSHQFTVLFAGGFVSNIRQLVWGSILNSHSFNVYILFPPLPLSSFFQRSQARHLLMPVIQTLVRMRPSVIAWNRTSTVRVLKATKERCVKGSKRIAKPLHVKVAKGICRGKGLE